MSAKAKLILVGVLASVALTGLWYVLLWSPTSAKLDDANAQKAAAEANTATLQARLTSLKALEARAPQLEADRAVLATAIPDTDQLDTFILAVDAKAAEARVNFVSIAPAPPAAATTPGAAAGPPAINLAIQVTGEYFSVLRFLDLLRDGDRLVTVENVSLGKGGVDGEMSASITGRMFLAELPTQPDAPAADGTAAPAPAPAG